MARIFRVICLRWKQPFWPPVQARGMAGGVRVTRKDTALRRQASAVARYSGGLLKDDHPDSGCGLKVVDRDIFVNLPFFNHMHPIYAGAGAP